MRGCLPEKGRQHSHDAAVTPTVLSTDYPTWYSALLLGELSLALLGAHRP